MNVWRWVLGGGLGVPWTVNPLHDGPKAGAEAPVTAKTSYFRSSDYPSLGAGGHRATSVGKLSPMLIRRTWPGPGGSNLSLDVQRSRGCGYECRAWGVWRILGVEPQWPTAFEKPRGGL